MCFGKKPFVLKYKKAPKGRVPLTVTLKPANKNILLTIIIYVTNGNCAIAIRTSKVRQ